jgi:hypothetical protein
VDASLPGSRWMPITPITGSLFHAYSQVSYKIKNHEPFTSESRVRRQHLTLELRRATMLQNQLMQGGRLEWRHFPVDVFSISLAL